MIACGREDRNWSDKKAEGEDGFKTLECLRGRLQAERQASRSAKKDAELMGNKLIELEKQLKEEIRLKKRAEKKLMLLKKKLESLKISVSEDQLGSSTNSEVSCESSTTSSNQQNTEIQEPNNQIKNPMSSVKMEDNASETSNSIEDNSSPQVTSSSNSNSKSCQSYEDSKIYQESFSSSKESKTEIVIEKDEFVDDTWALVPVSWPEPPPEKMVAAEARIMSGSVDEVLDVLRHARERLKCSVERRRNMIRVGPACN